MPTVKRTQTKRTTKLSDEDKILGTKKPKTNDDIVDYENTERKYKITNLLINNNSVTVTGDLVETFIGCTNREARYALMDGAKSVVTKDLEGNKLYKIEVIE